MHRFNETQSFFFNILGFLLFGKIIYFHNHVEFATAVVVPCGVCLENFSKDKDTVLIFFHALFLIFSISWSWIAFAFTLVN